MPVTKCPAVCCRWPRCECKVDVVFSAAFSTSPLHKTAPRANAEACGRDCREPATCAWPKCACPIIAREKAAA